MITLSLIQLVAQCLYNPLFGGFKNNVYIVIYELKKELLNIRLEIENQEDEEVVKKLVERENQILKSLDEFYN
jgi:hypothetical protein